MTYLFVVLGCIIISLVGVWIKRRNSGERSEMRLATGLIFTGPVLAALIGLVFSFTIVQPGHIVFQRTFGNLSESTHGNGIHFLNPFSKIIERNIQRRAVNYTGDRTAVGLTRNQVALTVDVTVPWMLNAASAPVLYERYGDMEEVQALINSSSRKAIRDCTSALDWQDAVAESGRAQMSTCISETVAAVAIEDLMQAGLTERQSQEAFTFPAAQVRQMTPRDKRILAAVAEEQAAVIDLRRQETLTAIAEEEANRRANEGAGVRKMMDELPSGYSVSQMAAIINANANKTTAEAFLRSVENGNPNITVISGGAVPVTTSAN